MEDYYERLKNILNIIYEMDNIDEEILYDMLTINNEDIKNNICHSKQEILKDIDTCLTNKNLISDRNISQNYYWKYFCKNNPFFTEDDLAYKLYLPVTNDCLEKFALLLLIECEKNNIDYIFKINNLSNVNRSDNVVIYATKENFEDYINIIKTILEKNLISLDLSLKHLLAFPYDDIISLAPYIDINGESFTSIICVKIIKIKKKSDSFEKFYLKVLSMLNTYYKYIPKKEKNNLKKYHIKKIK